MQEYSKIRTFLIQRKNNAPLLPERSMTGQAGKYEHIMIPAIAYQVCLTQPSVHENIVTRTVVDLAGYYERSGFEFGKILDLIAERTKLERALVKAILKHHKNTLDVESDEENDEPTPEFYYVLYDPIMKICFPDLIPKKEYDQNTNFEETQPAWIDLNRGFGIFSFSLSMSDSRRFRCNVLSCSLDYKDVPKDPKDFYSPRIISKYLRNPKNKLEYTGISEAVGLICTCYVAEADLSKIHVMNPVDHGNMDHLMESITAGIKSFPERNDELSTCVQELDKARKLLLEKAETFLDAADESKKDVLINFPEINQYPEVLEKAAEVTAYRKSYIHALESENTADPSSLNDLGRSFVIAFYTLLEKIFAISVVKNCPLDKVRQMDELVVHLKGYRNCVPYFAGLAEQIGLDDADMTVDFFQSPEGKVKINNLKAILSAAFSGGKFPESLPELVVAHFIQATVSEDHPFRRAVMKCPTLLRTVKCFLWKRNAAKHGNAVKEVGAFVMERQDINEMFVLAEAMIDILLVPRAASGSERNHNKEVFDNRRNALIKAKEELKNYSALCDEREAAVHDVAEDVCYRFHYKDPEYFSECSNLLSALLDLLIREFTVRSQLRSAADWFEGNKFLDDTKIHNLFDKYSCDYVSDDKPDTSKVRTMINNPFRLSLKCKLYLAFVVLDKEKPEFLRKILLQVPSLPKIADTVCVSRGHSEATDFSLSPDGYQAFHKEFLEICNTFYEVLKGGE